MLDGLGGRRWWAGAEARVSSFGECEFVGSSMLDARRIRGKTVVGWCRGACEFVGGSMSGERSGGVSPHPRSEEGRTV
jgi:hypothetical protein